MQLCSVQRMNRQDARCHRGVGLQLEFHRPLKGCPKVFSQVLVALSQGHPPWYLCHQQLDEMTRSRACRAAHTCACSFAPSLRWILCCSHACVACRFALSLPKHTPWKQLGQELRLAAATPAVAALSPFAHPNAGPSRAGVVQKGGSQAAQ